MSKLITLFEDRTTKLNIEKSQYLDIMKLRDILGYQNVRLDYDGTLQIMHYVGFVSIGNTRIQVLPKIMENGSFSEDELIKESMKSLYNMLIKSEFDEVKDLPTFQDLNTFNYDLLEIFISIFAHKVLEIYSLRMNYEYNLTRENQIYIKGKIDVSNTIKENNKGLLNHSIIFDYYGENNDLNNIIKTVLILLLNISKNSNNIISLKKCLMLFDNCTEINLSVDVFKRIRFTRLNILYKPAFDMAKMFFFNSNPEFRAGKESVYSFMVPVNTLFETYVGKILSEDSDLTIECQNSKSFIRYKNGNGLLELRPDYLAYSGKTLSFIGDAKYKNAYKEGKLSISSSDYQQLYSYAKLHNCNKVCFYFPKFKGNENKDTELETLEDIPVQISVKFIDVLS